MTNDYTIIGDDVYIILDRRNGQKVAKRAEVFTHSKEADICG